MKSILDKDFKYVPSTKTDIRKTFEKARKEQKNLAKVQSVPQAQSFNIYFNKKFY
jgi:hypothetical protein